jgi:hypothetical protein
VSEKITLFIPNGNIREVRYTARKCMKMDRGKKNRQKINNQTDSRQKDRNISDQKDKKYKQVNGHIHEICYHW